MRTFLRIIFLYLIQNADPFQKTQQVNAGPMMCQRCRHSANVRQCLVCMRCNAHPSHSPLDKKVHAINNCIITRIFNFDVTFSERV